MLDVYFEILKKKKVLYTNLLENIKFSDEKLKLAESLVRKINKAEEDGRWRAKQKDTINSYKKKKAHFLIL